ncbi:poly-beta-1,6-N-acetyl-D-glucosamine N-deacetylase PgaB [Sulfurirhabdus autotrophica]|uniref:Biofilm PGA synthesis lipoprotein PgaB n=1 Tax=Sulfurirhabdus autotrophica TaxID=1706046 RepID=A0A4R3Y476_9PROT|nr:poly-beta-1,6-N-acetyl-D-glucosamine N-deacetylase PgaB [Sulfurirhabdus autotrophica]TCV85154.1 biofilm PGA synthesis lipoprotein PgaB [Sulfurirhabdus autotrophica]
MHFILPKFFSLLLGVLLFLGLTLPARAADNAYLVLCYHDVVKDVRAEPDPDAVDLDQLVAQFSWLKENGYHPISVDDILAAQKGGKALPDKAALLTFDDGYRNFYEEVFPLLKAFNFPAVLALVGSWMDAPENGTVLYGDRPLSRSKFVSWKNVKEMQSSGLIEIASHSYNLHRGILANPQGNQEPAAVTRTYNASTQQYESDTAFQSRIREDLARNSQLIEEKIGKRPRIIVWPYGRYSQETSEIAEQLGMPVQFTLEDGMNHANTSAAQREIRRFLIHFNPPLTGFADTLRVTTPKPVMRLMHIDLDYVYDTDPDQQEKNLSRLLDRVLESGANTVFLQAYADPAGRGTAQALYFPNRRMSMRADLFNRVAWQLASRASVRVYAWLPLLAFELPDNDPASKHLVVAANGDTSGYRRLSPFSPQARQAIKEIYEDLAKNTPISGLLFHDDATLSDYEDASSQALAYYASEWKLPDSVPAIRNTPALLNQWTKAKTKYLVDFSLALRDSAGRYRPGLLTARNLYASVALNPESEAWFAQSLPVFLNAYDWTAIMAMPYMENAADTEIWLKTLATKVLTEPQAQGKVVFELQGTDWRTNTAVSGNTLAQQMRLLKLNGAKSVGYYPDDFIQNRPTLDEVKLELSLRVFPNR